MILINKEEKEAIHAMYPDVCIVRTMRQDSGRHHYYLEEAPRALRLLGKMRGTELVPEPRNAQRKRGGFNRGR